MSELEISQDQVRAQSDNPQSNFQFARLDVVLANGNNDNIATQGYNYLRVTGPSAAFAIRGFAGGIRGAMLFVEINVTQVLTISNLSTGSLVGNRIFTSTNADRVYDAAALLLLFIYDEDVFEGHGAWRLLDALPQHTHASSEGYILIRDEKTSGTNGGTFTSGDWRTRTLNTESFDTGSHCTLSNNQFTLVAGTYRIKASAPAYLCDAHQIRLQNITDGTTTATGTSEYASASSYVANHSFLDYRFTITGSKTFEIQHRCQTDRSTNGLGVAGSFGTEVYAVVELIRE